MSLAATRVAIAQAASTVAGCHGHEKRPEVPNEGDVWAILGPADRASGTAFLQTWLIRVLPPQDEYAASDWWDEHWAPLFYALSPVGYITTTRPVVLSSNAGDLLAFEIVMQAEE